MPKVTTRRSERIPIRLPAAIVAEIDRIVREHPEFSYNRQQFVESSVRDKIEKAKLFEQRASKK